MTKRPASGAPPRDGRVKWAARKAVFGIADRLNPSRRQVFLQLATSARDLGRSAAGLLKPRTSRLGKPTQQVHSGHYPASFRISPVPRDIPDPWPEPPAVERTGTNPSLKNIYETGPRKHRFDVELMEELNREYESKPIVAEAPSYEPEAMADVAKRRLFGVHRSIDLAGKRVLEIGCGNGYEVWYLAHHFGSDAWGVDVVEREPWDVLADDRTHFECADITAKNPLPTGYFDRVISFVVWEHILHPRRAIKETFEMMAPGGIAWIRANLYRGPKASHLYREIFFPWPHLLFSEDVIEEFLRRTDKHWLHPVWVNRLSWLEYERAFLDAGFRIKALTFDESPFDEEFYQRFEHMLGRYPRWDLTKDFFTVVLEKPRS